MANYTIIGGDKKEYGPVTDAEVRQWLAEGRLDAFTLARSDSDTEWRPLSTFPEFGTVFQNRPAPPPPLTALPRHRPGTAEQDVKTPALCLMVVASVNLLLALWSIVQALVSPVTPDKIMAQMPVSPDPQTQQMMASLAHLMTGPAAIVSDVLGLVMSLVILVGAARMRALRNYEFAMVATIAALVPCLTPCLGYLLLRPAVLWALFVLKRPGVKDQFN